MNKRIIINDRYTFVYLEKALPIKRDEARTGFLFDSKDNAVVLYLHVVRDLINKEHQSFCLTNKTFMVGENKKAGLALIDDLVFFLDYVITKRGPTMLMHELGHYLNCDLDNCDLDYSKERRLMLKEGVVMENEYKADEFAIKECGLEAFLDSLDWMESVRKHVFCDSSEFGKRREHAIEYARTLS